MRRERGHIEGSQIALRAIIVNEHKHREKERGREGEIEGEREGN